MVAKLRQSLKKKPAFHQAGFFIALFIALFIADVDLACISSSAISLWNWWLSHQHRGLRHAHVVGCCAC